jgi:FkbM family methyltransferase
MSKANFNEYMEWSYPLVQFCMTRPDSFIQSDPRSISYVVERLFVLWYALREKRITHVGPLAQIMYQNPFLARGPAAAAQIDGHKRFITLSDWHVTLKELCDRHRVRPRGIIHIGAHYAEEREIYQSMGVENVLWIEADPNNMPQLQANVASLPGHRALQACISKEDGKATPFFRTNNAGESSSMLPMGTHKEMFRDIHVTEQTTLQTVTFGKLVRDAEINLDNYDFLVMDIQGAELMALQGFGDLLHRFNGAYLEVNVEPLYQGCALMNEIDEFFDAEGLTRRETLITQRQYGDALYLRDSVFAPLAADLPQRAHQARAQLVLGRNFIYRIAGHGQRAIELLETGQVGEGKGQLEQVWIVRPAGPEFVLEFVGAHGRTCSLRQGADGIWRGQLLFPPHVDIELLPQNAA